MNVFWLQLLYQHMCMKVFEKPDFFCTRVLKAVASLSPFLSVCTVYITYKLYKVMVLCQYLMTALRVVTET